jgi:chemotaxis protein histidine kinase CheA
MTERPLPPPRWMRATARSLLFTFTTSILAACGGAPGEAPATTTTLVEDVPPTTLGQQDIPTPPAPPPAAAAPPSTLPEQPPQQLSKEELRELVAPVALYPDVVLASLLPATTFPDQLQDAAQYVGDAQIVESVPQDRGWDGSIVGLLQFPDVVRWLDANPAWADEMGQAVTYQQGDVLQAIQDYRHQVQQAGNLKSNQYQKVVARPGRDILIQPAQPDVVYVPSYDPVAAVQPQPAVVQEQSSGINPWLAFGGGALVGALGAYALYSIFDDDKDVRVYNNYYGGGGRGRRIRNYDNYYYARGRRPRYAAWNPRPRPYRNQGQNWQRPQRLRYANTKPVDRKKVRALRPPTNLAAAQAPTAKQIRQQQQKENRQLQQQMQRDKRQQQQLERQQRQQAQKQQRQEKKQAQQVQRQEKKQAQQMQKQQRQQQQRAQRQQKQAQQQQRQQQQREQRQQNKAAQQQRQQQQREQRQQQQQQRQQERQLQQQQRQQQRQENRQQKQMQRQENRQQKQGGGGGGGGGGNNKKKQNKKNN